MRKLWKWITKAQNVDNNILGDLTEKKTNCKSICFINQTIKIWMKNELRAWISVNSQKV